MTEYFKCPNCGEALKTKASSLVCPNNHCFDISKNGYVNLITVQNKNSKDPGDNIEMVTARREFLASGNYQKLAEKIAEKAYELSQKISENDELVFLDGGCGEGYYDAILADFLVQKGVKNAIICTDIAKKAVEKAAKACKNVQITCKNDAFSAHFAVASTYNLPIISKSVDIILNIFAPHSPEEFARVLKNDGHILTVVPAPKHLWELKAFLYETPYENPPANLDFDGFEVAEKIMVTYEMELENKELNSLFAMTPYAYKTPVSAKERLKKCDKMDVTADFEIWCFKKARN